MFRIPGRIKIKFGQVLVKLRPATLLKKRLWHRCFPMNFAKFLRTPFFTEHLRWLLELLETQRSESLVLNVFPQSSNKKAVIFVIHNLKIEMVKSQKRILLLTGYSQSGNEVFVRCV